MEARKSTNNYQHNESSINKEINADKTLDNDNITISIPVIPYKE